MRIQALDSAGAIAGEFPSIQAARGAGYSLQRVHACLHGKAISHRGLTRRRVDGLHSLPQFIADRIIRTTGKWLTIDSAYQAFLEWLPAKERKSVSQPEFAAAMVERFDSRSPHSIGFAELRAA